MHSKQLAMSDKEFELFRTLIYDRVGIHLPSEKRQLVVARLQELVLRDGYSSFVDYYDAVLVKPSVKDLTELVDRISTNHTYFNRESSHFEYLDEVVFPEIESRAKTTGKKELRMWCAAASTGQEPYTLAMLQMRYFGREFSSWDAGLLATDISQRALAVAKKGHYSKDEISALPNDLQKKFLIPTDGGFEIAAEVKREVLYRRLNLMTPRFPFKRPFDVIFCRNVMIYFDEGTKREVVRKMVEFLRPGGYLFVGKAESVGQFNDKLGYAAPGAYRRQE